MSDPIRTEQSAALLRSVIARLGCASPDELRVVDVILIRLELGRDRYGLLDLSKPRDWEVERAEELVDAAVYAACGVISDRDQRAAAIDAFADSCTEREPG